MPPSIQSHDRKRVSDETLALRLAVVSLIIYVLTLCPTIFTDDCGEIATAVATGGVMHPPGYPLYCIVGGLFVKLIPWGEPAFRLGLFSAISAAVAVALTFLLCRRLGAGRRWSLAGALVFAFSFSLWQQATKVETYALNAAFVGTLLLLASNYERTGETKRFYALALVGGIALTNHLTILWMIPAVLCVVLPKLVETHGISGAARVVVCASLITALPLSLYGYEMIAARTHPAGEVWGDPSTIHRLVLHVTGARYHRLFQWPTLSWLYQRDVLFAPAFLWRNAGPMLILTALGVRTALRQPKRRRLAVGLLAGIAGYVVCDTLYRILNIFEYYTPVVLMLCVLGAAGGQWLSSKASTRWTSLEARRPLSMVKTAAVLLAFGVPVLVNWTACNRRNADYVRTMADNILNTLPHNATLVAYGDNEIFPLWYAQEVLHKRPDVVIVPRAFFIQWATPDGRAIDSWCIKRIEREHPETHLTQLMARSAVDANYARSAGALWDLIRTDLTDRKPVYFTSPEEGDLTTNSQGVQVLARISGATLMREGLTSRVTLLNQQPTQQQSLATALRLERKIRYQSAPSAMFEYEPDKDFTNRYYAQNLLLTGRLLENSNRYPAAYDRISSAYDLDPNTASTADAFAYASVLVGRTGDAIDAWRVATKLDPGNASYKKNLETALGQSRVS